MVHLFKPTSYTAGAALAVGSTLAWKLISFLNALLIALYFGAGNTTDIYFYLIMIIGFGVNFLQRMNAAVIIPEAMSQENQRAGSARPLLNTFLYGYLALLFLLTAAGLAAPVGIAGCFSRFEAARLTADKILISLCFILFGLQLLTAYLTAVLEMYRRFTSSLLTPLNALLPLVFLLGWGRSWGMISMVYGFLASYLIQISVFTWIMKRELSWDFRLVKPEWGKHLTKNLASNQLIEVANIVSSVLPLYLLSGLSAGLVSALNYAKQLSDSPSEIFTYRVANVSKIQLTEHAAQNNWKKLNTRFLSTQHFFLFVLTPLAVFSCFFAPEIVTLFFKRGDFTLKDVYNTAAFLRPLLGIMWFVAIISMQNNVVAAGRKVKESLPYALCCIGLFILAVPFTMKIWGAFAFPYTQLGCNIISLFINYLLFKRFFPQIAYLASLRDAGRILAVNLSALLPAGLCAWYTTQWGVWTELFISGSVFLTGVLFLSYKSGDWQLFKTHLPSRMIRKIKTSKSV